MRDWIGRSRGGLAIVLVAQLAACSSAGGADDGPGDRANGTGGSNVAGHDGLGSSQGSGSAEGTGSSTSAAGGSVGSASGQDCADIDTAPTVLRRLSALEYRLTVQDLLALPEPPDEEGIPLDNERLGFRTFAEYQTMSAENLRGYMEKAASLARTLLADPQRRDVVVGCELEDASCLDDFVKRFGRLAYRRTLAAEEVEEITGAANEFGADAQDRFSFALEAILSSSQFLYRVELGDRPEGLSQLTAEELASKLSFSLFGRGPSLDLLDRAAAGELDSPEGLAAVASEMLADERTQIFFQQFFRQWLGYQTLKPPSSAEAAVFADMQLETDRLLEEFAWEGGDFLDVLTADYTYVSDELATYYGLPAPDFVGRVDFPADDPRAHSGILTHASLLSAKGDGDLIAIRGSWLLRTFLCEEIHLPPDFASTIGDLLVGLDKVGIVKARNTERECVGCHSLLDPIGVGFAAFDRTGIFDESEDPSVYGIEPSVSLAPEPNEFSTIGGLSSLIASMPVVPHCITERAYLYVNGREPTPTDACSVDQSASSFEARSRDFRGLLSALVADAAFRFRRAPELAEGGEPL